MNVCPHIATHIEIQIYPHRFKINTDIHRHIYIHREMYRHTEAHMGIHRHIGTQAHRDVHIHTDTHSKTHVQTHRHTFEICLYPLCFSMWYEVFEANYNFSSMFTW